MCPTPSPFSIVEGRKDVLLSLSSLVPSHDRRTDTGKANAEDAATDDKAVNGITKITMSLFDWDSAADEKTLRVELETNFLLLLRSILRATTSEVTRSEKKRKKDQGERK